MNLSAIPGAGNGDQPPSPVNQVGDGSGKERQAFKLGGNGGGDQPPELLKAGGSNGNGNEPSALVAASGNGVRPGGADEGFEFAFNHELIILAVIAGFAAWVFVHKRK